MRFVLITADSSLSDSAREGLHPSDELETYSDWSAALDLARGADMIIVDMIATLAEPNKVAGYEAFARAKMTHPDAAGIPLVVISPETDYDLDFVSGWPDFCIANVRRPCDYRIFRRASTWV